MKKLTSTFILCLFCFSLAFAQYTRNDGMYDGNEKESSGFSMDRIFLGGSLGAQFGTFTFINISPDIGYWLTDRFMAGVGGRYMYFNDRVFNFNTSIVGASAFGRYLITDEIFGHVEYEVLNGRFDPTSENTMNVAGLFVGGGYMQMFGDRFFSGIMVLYNLNDNIYSPYTNPIIRVNFGIGL